MMLIKICGITEPELAFKAAQLGADFIGLIFYKQSKRYVNIEQAIAIAEHAQQGGAQPVGVFVEHTAEEIIAICQQTGINIVQLHGETARYTQPELPAEFQRIYVVNVNYDGTIIADKKIKYLRQAHDFILYDGLDHGSGRAFYLDNFSPLAQFRFFLAGGLNANNVKLAITKVNPFVVYV